MATLAIEGHATRGSEVIELLEMLGGKNRYNEKGFRCGDCYFISNAGNICSDFPANLEEIELFTLEEFLEKFPYKIRDKVLYKDVCKRNVHWIKKIEWVGDEVKYGIDYGVGFTLTNIKSKDLRPYTEQKEETMEEAIQLVPVLDKDSNKVIYYRDEKTSINYAPMNETTLHLVDGYELVDENGNVINAKTVTLTKKQPKCPKTYEECCDVLGIEEDLWFVYEDIDDNHINPACISNYRMRRLDFYHNLEKLIICRDAYWKIAGNWKPDAMYCDLHCIGYDGNLVTWKMQGGSRLLAFPTEEMRDAFYENFKDLIEQCKELL